jgi:CheY-like chemotaxis protein
VTAREELVVTGERSSRSRGRSGTAVAGRILLGKLSEIRAARQAASLRDAIDASQECVVHQPAAVKPCPVSVPHPVRGRRISGHDPATVRHFPCVLICDDESSLRRLIRAAIADEGYHVLEAVDGDESLALIERHKPDLVILDLLMPGRDGLDVLRQLRADGALSSTRVIMLTTSTSEQHRAAALALGADCFLTKPFSPHELAIVVKEMLEPPPGS